MTTPRLILTTLAILAAPFVVLIGLFVIIRGLLNDGIGPDDGANMFAMMIAFPAAGLTAVCVWSVALIYGLASFFSREKNPPDTGS